MKKIIGIFIIFLCIPFTINAQNDMGLPYKAVQFLYLHFPRYEVVKYQYDADDLEYEVKLRSGHEVEFDIEGDWIEIESEYSPIPKSIIDLLPIGIIQYVSQNYARRAIISIEKKKYGFEIELSNSEKLKFDKKGSFIRKG